MPNIYLTSDISMIDRAVHRTTIGSFQNTTPFTSILSLHDTDSTFSSVIYLGGTTEQDYFHEPAEWNSDCIHSNSFGPNITISFDLSDDGEPKVPTYFGLMRTKTQ